MPKTPTRGVLAAARTLRSRVSVPIGAAKVLIRLSVPAGAQSADELAKQTQNPVASLISVPFQGNWDFGLGDRDSTATLLNVQPVMPFAISKSTNVILKVTLLGKRPTSFALAAGPTMGPDAGADWRFRLAATFLFPR